MAKSPKQKQKLLFIAQYLLEKTDENHFVTTNQIISHLAANDIKAERKSVYDDVDTLNDFGMDIVKVTGRAGGYYVASREFELAELKLMVDSVQSSKFITQKKSRELIGKLEKLASINDAKQLQRQVVVSNRNKTVNENIYYNVDMIYNAMALDVKVRYQYFDWDVNKKMKLRKNGEFYEVSPWLLTWDDENYYLIAYDSEAGIMKHYRVDKMQKIEQSESIREGRLEFEKIDVAAYAKKTFGMFAGEEKTVTLRLKESMAGIIVDRFGNDVAMRPGGEGEILARVSVAVSPQFFGWLAGLGSQIQIQSPDSVRKEYYAYIMDIAKNYEE